MNYTSEKEWDKIKASIYFEDGSWRDLYVLNADLEDWAKWISYVNQNCQVNWCNGKTDTTHNRIDSNEIQKELANPNPEYACSFASIFLGNIQINCHFFAETEIENDIDPREIKSFEDHQKILKYMTDIAAILNKKVRLTLENMEEIILIKV